MSRCPLSRPGEGSRQLTQRSTDPGRGISSLSTNRRARPASTVFGVGRAADRRRTGSCGRRRCGRPGCTRAASGRGPRGSCIAPGSGCRRDSPLRAGSTPRMPCWPSCATPPTPSGPRRYEFAARSRAGPVPGDARAADPRTGRAGRAGGAAAGGRWRWRWRWRRSTDIGFLPLRTR